nr:hypothetical protein BaRGS_034129 [Batillaria attramentaria]
MITRPAPQVPQFPGLHAICGPSRASFMTGRRSDTTRVMNLVDYWRTVGGNFTTVSQYFKDNGYLAEGLGKIYHIDLYPESVDIPLAEHRDVNTNLPSVVWTNFGELRAYDDIAALNLSAANNYRINDTKQYELRRGYAAATSYVDAMVGKVLQALTDNRLDDNTIVVFCSDHGFQLGENGQWTKHNYETSVRIPFLVRVPGVTDNNDGFQSIDLFNYTAQDYGTTPSTKRPVELVDLFPTLAELAGLSVPAMCPLNSSNVETCVEGASLVPLIREAALNGSVAWKDVAFSQYPRNWPNWSWMGYTMRTRQFRYTEWVSFDFSTFQADWSTINVKELYLHDVNLDGNDVDVEEHLNEVDNPAYSGIVTDLAQKLRDNWFVALQDYHNQK